MTVFSRVCGSWIFISIFCLTIICWMSLNSYMLVSHPFDPYPTHQWERLVMIQEVQMELINEQRRYPARDDGNEDNV
jgi:uncharacterized membrane protein